MTIEARLQEKLRKIEALFAGAGTPGERDAAEAALHRLRARLAEQLKTEEPIEMKFSLGDEWSLPKSYADEVLWPEFTQLHETLRQYLGEVTTKLVRDTVFADTSEAAEVDEGVARIGAE